VGAKSVDTDLPPLYSVSVSVTAGIIAASSGNLDAGNKSSRLVRCSRT